MNILLIDDDPTTIESLLQKIQWQAFGFNEPYTACHAEGAKEILQNNPIDIMLCDIELPGESGLDLLEWVHSQNMDIECIFLTNYMDFSYARRAVRLHAYDYVSKTESTETLTEILRNVYKKVQLKHEDVINYKDIRTLKQKELTQHLFKDIILDAIPTTQDMLSEIVANHPFPFPPAQTFLPVMLVFNKYSESFRHIPLDELNFIIDNVLTELTSLKNGTYIVSTSTLDVLYYCVFFEYSVTKDPTTFEEIRQTIFSSVHQFFKQTVVLPPTIYFFTERLFLWDFPHWFKTAKQLDSTNVTTRYQIVHAKSLNQLPDASCTLSLPENFSSFIEGHRENQLLQEIRHTLQTAARQNRLSEINLEKYQMDIQQQIYVLLNKYELPASQILDEQQLSQLFSSAANSVIDLIKWVNVLLPKISALISEKQNENAPEKKMLAFIHEHYMEKITRNEIAEIVHLNPDYAARLFKTATGYTVVDYLLHYRIQKAKELMLYSTHNISDIAQIVGFESFSYFSAAFRRLEGVTPRSFKKEHLSDRKTLN